MADAAFATPAAERHTRAKGLAYGLASYAVWGLAPVYFKSVRAASALEIAAHRIVWSVLFLLVVAVATRRLGALRTVVSSWRRLGLYATTAALTTANWFLQIWAVNTDRVLEVSLGNFLMPLVNILLGVIFLRERLRPLQSVAVAIAAAGVVWLGAGHGAFPWIAVTTALNFGLWALLRKKARVDPLLGLLVETALVAPFAVALLGYQAAAGTGAFVAAGPGVTALLLAAGVITALPLMGFTAAANRLPLSTTGLLHYLTPVSHLLLAVLAYGEPFTSAHAVVFAGIWSSLALYTVDALWLRR